MGDICKNKLFKENEYVVFGDPTNKRAWLLNMDFKLIKIIQCGNYLDAIYADHIKKKLFLN